MGLPFDRDISTEQLSKLIQNEESRREKERQDSEKGKVIETKPTKQPRKRSAKTKKVLQKFTVLHGEEAHEIEASDPRGAALKIAKLLHGTKEKPEIVTVGEKIFETYLDEKNRPHVRKIERPVVIQEENMIENEESKQEEKEI